MAAEARAMLDALMGSDRNAAIPKSGHNNLQRKKKSCYDHDICPLYCAWGIDVYELFTNTKSDLGPNPSVVQDDAREEWLTLPDHEKDRLGYEMMLHRKLGELVRSCDRIVNRNKEKLRVEIAKAAKARGAAGRTIDPATDVDEGMLLEAAEVMADLELREEEVSEMLQTLMSLDGEWKELWGKLKELEKGPDVKLEAKSDANASDEPVDGEKDAGAKKSGEEVKIEEAATSATSDVGAGAGVNASKNDSTEGQGEGQENEGEKNNNDNNIDNEKDKQKNKEDNEKSKQIQINELKSKLYKLSAQQQKIISSLSILTSQTIVPLRDNLQNLSKQLYYVKTDTSSDKTVCEVSGNFMSSRDAEERIAAHYAGKQYVGWKMVRDKFRELNKKYSHGRMGGNGGYHGGGGGPRGGGGYGGRGGGGYGYGHGNNYGNNHGQNRHHGPPGHGGPSPQYGRQYDRDRRRERSRSRDRDGSSSRSRHHRRRSPSPPRWKRDRGYGGRR